MQARRVPEELRGMRLDQAAARLFPDYSRARLQGWIKSGRLLLDHQCARARDKLLGGELLTLAVESSTQAAPQGEAMPLEVVFEDEILIVINKPANLVVHPGAGIRSGTLLNGLLHRWPALGELPRAGILHRLDKDTTGLLAIAKTQDSQRKLTAQLKNRRIRRIYQGIVHGAVIAGGVVNAPLGRHPRHRTRRAVSSGDDAREAISHYRVLRKFRSHTHIQVELETGRTHQIRAHFSHIGFPLVGDRSYGGRARTPRDASPPLISALRSFRRQALHAWKLGLMHPQSGQEMHWRADLPTDMQELLRVMEADESQVLPSS